VYNMTSDEYGDAVVFLRILGFTGSNHRNQGNQGKRMHPRYTVYNMIAKTITQVPHSDISVPDYAICIVSFPDSQKSRNETVPYSPHDVDCWAPGKKTPNILRNTPLYQHPHQCNVYSNLHIILPLIVETLFQIPLIWRLCT